MSWPSAPDGAELMDARLVPLTAVDDHLLHQWQELARRSLEPNPFFEPAMTLNAATLPEAPEVALLVVHDDDRLQLLAPVHCAPRYRRIPVPVLTTWAHDYCLLGTPLVAPENSTAALAAAVRLLRQDRPAPWWVLEGMVADGPVAHALHEALTLQGLSAKGTLQHERGAFLPPADGHEVKAGPSTKTLKALRRRRRRLAEVLGEEVRTVDAAAVDLDVAVEGFLRSEASGWKGIDGGAFLSRPGHAEFFRKMCRDFAAEGRLEMYTLGTSTTAVAYQCNLIAQDRVFNFKIAYDEDYRRYSTGVLLDLDALEAFHTQDDMIAIDSCAAEGNEAVTRLLPHTLTINTLLIPLGGLRGRAAAHATQGVIALGRRVRAWRQSRQEDPE